MNLSSISRTKMTKGVSVLALFALVGVGYNLRPDVEPESMRLKTLAELEGLADPLFEELFQDKYHRALEAYTESKGLFSCDDVCHVHKRRLDHDEVELTLVLADRLAARKAILIRGREQRLAGMQERQAEAAQLRAFREMTNDQRISVRKAVRKGERDAERANTISAYRASLGLGPPLTLAEKQERAAAKAAARIAAREAMVSPAQRMADAQANQDAQWYEYLDEVAQAHGFADWYNVELYMDATFEEKVALKEGNHNSSLLVSRGNVRAAARGATLRTPAPTPSPTPPPTVTPVCHLGRISGTFYHFTGTRCNRLILNAPDGTSAAMSNEVISCEASLAGLGGFNAQYPVGSTTVDNLGDVDNVHLYGGRITGCTSGVRESEVVLVQDANAAGVEMVMTRADSDICQHIWTISYPSCSSLLESYGI